MAFAVGRTPCVGPVLAGILTAAATTGNVGVGAGLLFVYSLAFPPARPWFFPGLGIGEALLVRDKDVFRLSRKPPCP